MAATADGNTSMRPHCRDWMSAVGVVLEAIERLMVQFGSARQRSFLVARLNSRRKVLHGQAMRDLRQDAAVRTSRQSRQEPGQPEVRTQPPDGPRDREGADVPGQGVHALPEDLLGLTQAPPAPAAPPPHEWGGPALREWGGQSVPHEWGGQSVPHEWGGPALREWGGPSHQLKSRPWTWAR